VQAEKRNKIYFAAGETENEGRKLKKYFMSFHSLTFLIELCTLLIFSFFAGNPFLRHYY